MLALYLLDVLAFEPAGAASVMSFFLAAAYLTPVLGGYIADRWLGRFGTIAAFALPYLAGHVVLAAVPTRIGLGVALVRLALGSGAINPNTSTLMARIYEAEKKSALPATSLRGPPTIEMTRRLSRSCVARSRRGTSPRR